MLREGRMQQDRTLVQGKLPIVARDKSRTRMPRAPAGHYKMHKFSTRFALGLNALFCGNYYKNKELNAKTTTGRAEFTIFCVLTHLFRKARIYTSN